MEDAPILVLKKNQRTKNRENVLFQEGENIKKIKSDVA